MSLADDLAAEKNQTATGPTCGMASVLAALGDEAPALKAALADPAYQHTQIGRVLRARGFNIGDSTIGRHRKGREHGGCHCPKDPG